MVSGQFTTFFLSTLLCLSLWPFCCHCAVSCACVLNIIFSLSLSCKLIISFSFLFVKGFFTFLWEILFYFTKLCAWERLFSSPLDNYYYIKSFFLLQVVMLHKFWEKNLCNFFVIFTWQKAGWYGIMEFRPAPSVRGRRKSQ